jgi:hypothetical protein
MHPHSWCLWYFRTSASSLRLEVGTMTGRRGRHLTPRNICAAG